jgi:hypothetical protein
VLVLIIASVVFGFVWWGLTRLNASVGVIAGVSFFLAMVVLQSGTLFGLAL